MTAPDNVVELPLREQFDAFIDEHRAVLHDCLEGLTEDEARRRLVDSDTTLLGLVKHVTFVERVWFEECVTGKSRAELGLVAGPPESFVLDDGDTIESVRATFRTTCERSRAASASIGLDDVVTGNRRGPLPFRWVLLHVLREFAGHCGHADILREQILAARRRQNR